MDYQDGNQQHMQNHLKWTLTNGILGCYNDQVF